MFSECSAPIRLATADFRHFAGVVNQNETLQSAQGGTVEPPVSRGGQGADTPHWDDDPFPPRHPIDSRHVLDRTRGRSPCAVIPVPRQFPACFSRRLSHRLAHRKTPVSHRCRLPICISGFPVIQGGPFRGPSIYVVYRHPPFPEVETMQKRVPVRTRTDGGRKPRKFRGFSVHSRGPPNDPSQAHLR